MKTYYKSLGNVILICFSALIFCQIAEAQQKIFDKERYMEVTTLLDPGSSAYVAVNDTTWLDLNDNGAVDADEVIIPVEQEDFSEKLKIQVFYVNVDKPNFRIYGDFDEIILRKWKHTNIDVSRMPQLTYLGVPYSQLEDLDVSKLTKLKSLECRNNRLSSLDLSHQEDLELIEAISNDLSELDISHKRNLFYIGIAHNRINGERMDNLVNTLPLRREGELNVGHFFAFTLNEPTEENVLTERQVAIAFGKYWEVYAWDNSVGDWVRYEGSPSDADKIANQALSITLSYTEGYLFLRGTVEDTPIYLYDLSGDLITSFLANDEMTIFPIRLPSGCYIVIHGESRNIFSVSDL